MALNRRVAAALVAFCFAFSALPAAATPDTLKRSIENLTQWPGDIILAPVTSTLSIYNNLRDIDDSLGVRIAYPLPGWIWNTMVNVGAGVLRGLTGVLELIPGLVLLFTEADMDPLFDPADENEALVDFENGIYDIKFGVDYTTAG
ncbi:MAG: hypothetical protein QNK05_17390 [Myxococcota bacterium]|nr:hypothetical protein [Myxococcota bacterium]